MAYFNDTATLETSISIDTTDAQNAAERPYLIFLNPSAGSGRALEQFRKVVDPRLKERRINYDLIITTHQFHAWSVAQRCNLSKYRAIISVSGDGLSYEILNGLLSRPDWRHALATIPLGVIAGGSGNALASSLAYCNGYNPTRDLVFINTITLLNPTPEPMDLVMVEYTTPRTDNVNQGFSEAYFHQNPSRLHPPNQGVWSSQMIMSCVSALSVSWGLLAEIDIDSEVCRCIGSTRFLFTSVLKIMKRPTSHGRLQYMPVDCDTEKEPTLLNTFPEISSKEKRSYPKSSFSSLNVISSTNIQQEVSLESSAKAPKEYYRWKYLPPLWEPLSASDGWITREEEFSTVLAVYQSHLASDTMVAPRSTFSDGLIYLLIIQGETSRTTLLAILSAFEKRQDIKKRGLEIIPVKAFRLFPTNPEGFMCVDGERIFHGPIQAEVFEKCTQILSRKRTLF